jgi:hypothetical protein
MNYLTAMTRNRGFAMADREAPQHNRGRNHDFVPAAQVLRERPLCASLVEVAWHHIDGSKRFARSLADFQHVGCLIARYI